MDFAKRKNSVIGIKVIKDIGQYCGVNGIIRNSFQLLGSAVDK